MRNLILMFCICVFAFNVAAIDKASLLADIAKTKSLIEFYDIREFHADYKPVWAQKKDALDALSQAPMNTVEEMIRVQKELAEFNLTLAKGLAQRKVAVVRLGCQQQGVGTAPLDQFAALINNAKNGMEIAQAIRKMVEFAKQQPIGVPQFAVEAHQNAMSQSNALMIAWWQANGKSPAVLAQLKAYQAEIDSKASACKSTDVALLNQAHLRLTTMEEEIKGIYMSSK